MAINETATGKKAVAVTGTATGEETIGILGKGDAVGVQGEGRDWHGVEGLSESTIGGAGVHGMNNKGSGIAGESKEWVGVFGRSESTTGGAGVRGEHNSGTGVHGTSQIGSGVIGSSTSGVGVWGSSQSSSGVGGVSDSGVGVHGVSKAGPGVRGDAENGVGVFGASKTSTGTGGVSDSGLGVHGISQSADGVWGSSESGRGVVGVAKTAAGVYGESDEYNGILGVSKANGHSGVAGVHDEGDGFGVYGRSKNGEGIYGETHSPNRAAIAAYMLNPDGVGAALHAENRGHGVGVFAKGGRLAGLFEGDVEVTGDIRLANADCAEDFDVSEPEMVDAGTVMVVGDEGTLYQSHQPYDRRVAGVVSGAGDYKPGIVLDKQQSRSNRKPIALLGKVFCKVDAQYGSIEVGDLLTTSPTPGHAMMTSDPLKAFGAVIGKALRPLTEGQGLIPILIALQ